MIPSITLHPIDGSEYNIASTSWTANHWSVGHPGYQLKLKKSWWIGCFTPILCGGCRAEELQGISKMFDLLFRTSTCWCLLHSNHMLMDVQLRSHCLKNVLLTIARTNSNTRCKGPCLRHFERCILFTWAPRWDFHHSCNHLSCRDHQQAATTLWVFGDFVWFC